MLDDLDHALIRYGPPAATEVLQDDSTDVAFLALVSFGEPLRETVDGLAFDKFESYR